MKNNKVQFIKKVDKIGYIQEIHIKYKDKDYCNLNVQNETPRNSYTENVLQLVDELLKDYFKSKKVAFYCTTINWNAHGVDNFTHLIQLTTGEMFTQKTKKQTGNISKLLNKLVSTLSKEF